jgi:hypothetical protein
MDLTKARLGWVELYAQTEPDRVSRRLFGLDQAAKAWTSA